jgi:hypothetical protein
MNIWYKQHHLLMNQFTTTYSKKPIGLLLSKQSYTYIRTWQTLLRLCYWTIWLCRCSQGDIRIFLNSRLLSWMHREPDSEFIHTSSVLTGSSSSFLCHVQWACVELIIFSSPCPKLASRKADQNGFGLWYLNIPKINTSIYWHLSYNNSDALNYDDKRNVPVGQAFPVSTITDSYMHGTTCINSTLVDSLLYKQWNDNMKFCVTELQGWRLKFEKLCSKGICKESYRTFIGMHMTCDHNIHMSSI